MQDFLERYSRTILLNDVGFEGQDAIFQAKVLLIGAGGLSSPILSFLASSGVSKVGIVEPDCLELSNLQRQFIYRTSDVGLLKADLAEGFLKGLNPALQVQTFKKSLSLETEAEFLGLVHGYDIIVDASDSFKTRVLSNRIAIKSRRPFFTGSALGFVGHVYSFFGFLEDKPCYSCLFGSDIEDFKEEKTCANSGIFPPVVGVVGSIIAFNILSFLINKDRFDFTKFTLIDFSKEKQFKELKIKKDRQCGICF